MAIFRQYTTPPPVVDVVTAAVAPAPEHETRRVESGHDEAPCAHGRVADHPAVKGGRALEDGEKSERAGEGDREAERDVARNEIEIEEDPEGPQVADGGDEAEEGECVVGQAVECVGAAGVGNGKRLPQQRKLSDECTNRRHRSENLWTGALNGGRVLKEDAF